MQINNNQNTATTARVSRSTAAIMEAYAKHFRQQTGTRIPNQTIIDRAVVLAHFKKLPQDVQANILLQFPELKNQVK